jgi:hypothetical protein
MRLKAALNFLKDLLQWYYFNCTRYALDLQCDNQEIPNEQMVLPYEKKTKKNRDFAQDVGIFPECTMRRH